MNTLAATLPETRTAILPNPACDTSHLDDAAIEAKLCEWAATLRLRTKPAELMRDGGLTLKELAEVELQREAVDNQDRARGGK